MHFEKAFTADSHYQQEAAAVNKECLFKVEEKQQLDLWI